MKIQSEVESLLNKKKKKRNDVGLQILNEKSNTELLAWVLFTVTTLGLCELVFCVCIVATNKGGMYTNNGIII